MTIILNGSEYVKIDASLLKTEADCMLYELTNMLEGAMTNDNFSLDSQLAQIIGKIGDVQLYINGIQDNDIISDFRA